MIEVLGPSVFPYLPIALEKLLADSEVCHFFLVGFLFSF